MKAQEYFEKYFENAKMETAKDIEEIGINAKKMFQDFADEVSKIEKKRNVKSLSGLVGIIRELNEKWNSVVGKVERKFSTKVLARNVIWNNFLSSLYPDEFMRKPEI